MWAVIVALDREGPPSKVRDERFVFLSPPCGEMLAIVNPRNNLARCFEWKAFNNLDLLLALDYDFHSAIANLKDWLDQYLSQRSKRQTTD